VFVANHPITITDSSLCYATAGILCQPPLMVWCVPAIHEFDQSERQWYMYCTVYSTPLVATPPQFALPIYWCIHQLHRLIHSRICWLNGRCVYRACNTSTMLLHRMTNFRDLQKSLPIDAICLAMCTSEAGEWVISMFWPPKVTCNYTGNCNLYL